MQLEHQSPPSAGCQKRPRRRGRSALQRPPLTAHRGGPAPQRQALLPVARRSRPVPRQSQKPAPTTAGRALCMCQTDRKEHQHRSAEARRERGRVRECHNDHKHLDISSRTFVASFSNSDGIWFCAWYFAKILATCAGEAFSGAHFPICTACAPKFQQKEKGSRECSCREVRHNEWLEMCTHLLVEVHHSLLLILDRAQARLPFRRGLGTSAQCRRSPEGCSLLWRSPEARSLLWRRPEGRSLLW